MNNVGSGFSVITTVRNGEQFLDQYFRVFKRAAAQEVIEIVVVDDNPSPSPAIAACIEALVGAGYRALVYFSFGAGRAYALNEGLRQASGRYCFIFDVDDVLFRRRFEIFQKDLEVGRAGAINLYSGYYGYPSLSNVKIRKIPIVSGGVDRLIQKGMPLPHTFMVVDKLMLGDLKYTNILAGLDYRLVSDAYLAGLRVNISNERVGIHLKYPDSSFAKRPRLKSQGAFLSTQIRVLYNKPSFFGLACVLARLLRMPFFVVIDAYKRRGGGWMK